MKRKRPVRSKHPGVKLNTRTLPSGRVQHRARWRDPDSGKVIDFTLDQNVLGSAEARTDWAIAKSKVLARRRMDLETGAPRAQAKPLTDAAKLYLDAAANRLEPSTLEQYKLAMGRLQRWAVSVGLKSTADLNRPRLVALREHAIAAPRVDVARGKRGAKRTSENARSPASVNSELRSVKAILNYWRLAGLTPAIDSDAITDTLKALPAPLDAPEYLTAAAITRVLRACLRHDAERHKETRAEHTGDGTPGNTPRYPAIAPFAAFLLLSGCRRGEALSLKWSDVDLDAKDASGQRVGEIRLRAEVTKTHRARTIGLEVSPVLRAILAAMRLQAGKDVADLAVFRDRDGNPYTADLVEAARDRLIGAAKPEAQRPGRTKKQTPPGYGAPPFTWQALRSTCATYLVNAPAIFGAASAYLAARQLGHSVAVAEKNYLGVHRGIDREARTLDDAMQAGPVLAEVLASVSARGTLPLDTIDSIDGTPRDGRRAS